MGKEAPDETREEVNPGRRRRRSRLSFARRFGPLLGILVFLGGLAWIGGAFFRDRAPSSKPARRVAPPHVSAQIGGPALSPLEEALGDLTKLPPEVQRYLDNTIYPPGTGRLTPDHIDLLEPNRRFEDFRPVPKTMSINPDEVVSVRLTSERYFYTGDEPVDVELDVRLGSLPIPAFSIDAALFREGRSGDEGRSVPLRFIEDGESSYAARVDTSRFADHHGNLRLDVLLEYAPGEFHHESLRLFLTPEGLIPARFSGEFREQVIGGNLRINVGIRVEQAGYYRIDANLYDRFGEPVAYSAFKGELTRSHKEVPIEFFGRLLHDVNGSGPFYVDNVRGYRFINGGHPDRERIPDLSRSYRTQFSDLSLVSENAYAGQDKLHMISLIMEDIANGIALEAPPAPGSPEAPSSPSESTASP